MSVRYECVCISVKGRVRILWFFTREGTLQVLSCGFQRLQVPVPGRWGPGCEEHIL